MKISRKNIHSDTFTILLIFFDPQDILDIERLIEQDNRQDSLTITIVVMENIEEIFALSRVADIRSS